MINKQEIMTHAKNHKLSANIIEKDYVLNWLLIGIAHNNTLNEKWIFKGGTCLKKCFFKEYRFSEDLDFTIIDDAHINAEFLKNEFNKISSYIYEESGIEVPLNSINFEEYKNPRGKLSVQGTISYKGPMLRTGNNSTVKIDLTNDEILINAAELREIHHPYSDIKNKQIKIKSYCIEEIFAEKLRALVERLRPRDLYDVIHLHLDNRWQPKRNIVLETLQKKCQYKNVEIPSIELIISMHKKQQELMHDWEDMLTHQISNLEPYEYYWQQLSKVFTWLYEK